MNRLPSKFNFDTAAADTGCVHWESCLTGSQIRSSLAPYCIDSVLVEEVKSTGKLASEEREVKTCIGSMNVFPSQSVVYPAALLECR